MNTGGSRSFLVLLISEVLGYLAFLLNLPFMVSVTFMVAFIGVVLVTVYRVDIIGGLVVPFLGPSTHVDVHLSGEEFLKAYATISFVFFVIWEIIRAVFRLKRATLRRQIWSAIVVASVGWGFVLVHVPVMGMVPGSSRAGSVVMIFMFYLLGLAGFALGAVVTRASDLLIDRILGVSFTDRASTSPGGR